MNRSSSISSGPSPQRQRRGFGARGFTLMEVMLAGAATAVVVGGVYLITQAGMIVGVKSLSTSSTTHASRYSLDRAQHLIQIAYDTPTLINSKGVAVSGTGPAEGLRFYRYAGGPYVINLPSAGLSGTTKTLSVTCDKTASVPPPAPQAYDAFIINTTILMSGSANQVTAYVAGGNSVSSSTNGNRITYTVTLSDPLTGSGGSAGVIPADTGTVTAVLIRPTAIVVTPTSDGRELRLFESFPKDDVVAVNGPHILLTSEIALKTSLSDPSASDPMSDANAKPFSLSTIDSRTFVNTDLRIRDSRYGKFLNTRQADEFATFAQLRSRIPTKCNPNE